MRVNRWMPGIMDEITEHSTHGVETVNIAERLALEAKVTLDKHEQRATKKDEILSRLEAGRTGMESIEQTDTLSALPSSGKRVRIKNLSNPSGEMFGAAEGTEGIFQPTAPIRRRRTRALSTPISGNMFGEVTVVLGPGEILVDVIGPDGKKHPAKMKQETFKQVSVDDGNPVMLIVEEADKQFVGKYLDGFVRKQGRIRSVSSKSIDKIMYA